MFFVITCKTNASPQYLIELLSRLLTLFKDFTGVLSEESLRQNFTLMYELLDEILDYGYVQNTVTSTLGYYVMNPPADLEKQNSLLNAFNSTGNAVTGLFIEQKTAKSTASARPISEKTDDIYIDVLEKINVDFSHNGGNVLRSEILGSIVVKSFLKGQPLLRFGLNSNLVVGRKGGANAPSYGDVVLDQVNFYQYVNTSEFERDRVLSVYPIDGEFTVLNYRATSYNSTRAWKMPIRLYPHVELVSEYKARLFIRLIADLDKSSHASNVVIRVPLPSFCSSISFSSDNNPDTSCEVKNDEHCFIWSIRRIDNSMEQSITASLTLEQKLPSHSQLWLLKRQLGPISAKFEIPMHNVSGLQLRFLKIGTQEENNSVKRWVRYVCQNGSYVCRIDE